LSLVEIVSRVNPLQNHQRRREHERHADGNEENGFAVGFHLMDVIEKHAGDAPLLFFPLYFFPAFVQVEIQFEVATLPFSSSGILHLDWSVAEHEKYLCLLPVFRHDSQSLELLSDELHGIFG
jgi:hypothetical protein